KRLEEAAKQAEAARVAEAKKAAEEQTTPVAQPVSTKASRHVIQVESTAYTNDAADNGTYSGRVLTATGHDVTDSILYNGMRIIAVDPSVIPLGTIVHLEGIGDAIALDTGGRIKGNIVDLLVDTKEEAIQWGRRHIQVTVN
ncbi:3D domain-containing protein, partial [Exiguobacterium himgiriensis]